MTTCPLCGEKTAAQDFVQLQHAMHEIFRTSIIKPPSLEAVCIRCYPHFITWFCEPTRES
jgi:hypothetical protein